MPRLEIYMMARGDSKSLTVIKRTISLFFRVRNVFPALTICLLFTISLFFYRGKALSASPRKLRVCQSPGASENSNSRPYTATTMTREREKRGITSINRQRDSPDNNRWASRGPCCSPSAARSAWARGRCEGRSRRTCRTDSCRPRNNCDCTARMHRRCRCRGCCRAGTTRSSPAASRARSGAWHN